MHSHVQKTREAIDRATDGLGIEQFTWHPDGKWCTAEILEHLALAYGGTAKALARVAEGGKSVATAQSLKQRIGTWVVTDGEFIPGGRKAPAGVTPKGSMPPDQLLPAIHGYLLEMDEAINACEAKIGTKTHIADHPVLGPLTATQWRKFHMVHTRHHMKQIAALRAKMKNAQSSP